MRFVQQPFNGQQLDPRILLAVWTLVEPALAASAIIIVVGSASEIKRPNSALRGHDGHEGANIIHFKFSPPSRSHDFRASFWSMSWKNFKPSMPVSALSSCPGMAAPPPAKPPTTGIDTCRVGQGLSPIPSLWKAMHFKFASWPNAFLSLLRSMKCQTGNIYAIHFRFIFWRREPPCRSRRTGPAPGRPRCCWR